MHLTIKYLIFENNISVSVSPQVRFRLSVCHSLLTSFIWLYSESQCLTPGMHRCDWLSSITWDGLTHMKLVSGCLDPLNR